MKRNHTYKTSRNLPTGFALRQVGARRQAFFYAVSLVVAICSLCWPRASSADITAIPGLRHWESQMLTYGQQHCKTMMTEKSSYGKAQSYSDLLAATYYDSTLVYLQISKYTKDTSWLACAQKAKAIYRDSYVLRPDLLGQVPGYWNFTNGFTMDYQTNADVISKNAVILLSKNAAFAGTWTPDYYTADASRSREVAYTIRSYLNAEKLGEPRRARLALLVNQQLAIIDKWFISKTFRSPAGYAAMGIPVGVYFIQPFMVGLSMEALIMYHEATGDARVLPNVKICLDWLWANAWVTADQAFWYQNWVADPSLSFSRRAGAPDLSLLIAPAYAWYYKMTGDTIYRDRGDQVFAGGVKGAYLYGAKQFNQNYSYGFDYVSRRNAGDVRTTLPTASTTPSGSTINIVGTTPTDSLVGTPEPSTPTADVSETGNVTVAPTPSTPATSAPSSSITSPSDDSSLPLKRGRKCKYTMSVAC